MTDRVDELAANVEALCARFGHSFQFRVIRAPVSVTTPAEAWPEDAVPRSRLGVTCPDCGADDWVFRRVKRKNGGRDGQGRECRPCAKERYRRARAALARNGGAT